MAMSCQSGISAYRVSVVIPAYNAGPYLSRTVHSVLNQTHAADEIIVIDDGSTDNTREVAEQFGSMITYIYQENSGASGARNTGIKAAGNEWIAFLDGDDEWLEGKLEKQIGLLKRNPHLDWTTGNFVICHCQQDSLEEKLDSAKAERLLGGREYFLEYFRAFALGATGWTGTMLIRRELLEEAGMFRVGQLLANDLDMWWRIGYLRPKIGYSPETLAVYHSHIPGSITKKFTDPKLLIELLERHLKLAGEYGRAEQFRYCGEHFLQYWIHQYLFDERIEHIREMIVRFDKVLPSFYKSILRLLTISPVATSTFLPLLRQANKILRLPI